jgi:MFS family permease
MVTADQREHRSRPRAFQVISALRHRDYRYYWLGFLVSILGWQVQALAQAYLVFDLTGSALNLGIISGSQAVSSTIFSLLGGVVADRFDRRKLLIATQLGGAGCSLVLASLVATGAVEVWQIAVIAFVFGCFQAFDQPARSALVPQLIHRADLMNAIALTSVVWQSSAILGPAIAGIVIAAGGTAACFYLAAAGFLAFVVALCAIHVRAQEVDTTPRKSFAGDLAAGFRYIRADGVLMALISLMFFNAFFGLSFVILLPVFAREELDIGAQGLGALFSAFGIGALVGTLVVASLGDFNHKGLLIIAGAIFFGALLIVFSLSTWLALSMALLVAIGVVRALYMTSGQTLLQIRLDDRFRGRVTAVYGLQWSLMPLGGLWAGVVADVWGAPAAVALGGLAVIVFSILVGFTQREFRLPLQPALAR